MRQTGPVGGEGFPSRRRSWAPGVLLPVVMAVATVAVVVACAAFFFLNGIPDWRPTWAERQISQVRVRGYHRTTVYIPSGSGPAHIRGAVAVFIGPLANDIPARVSGPGLVIRAPAEPMDLLDEEEVGEGTWQGCQVSVLRLKADHRPGVWVYLGLSSQQRTEVEAGRLSVIEVFLSSICVGS
jgi:hypothetical protein